MSAVFSFDSHVRGKKACVRIYPDRIEWEQGGSPRVGLSSMAMGGSTMSGLRQAGNRGTETLPIDAVTSVTVARNSLLRWTVSIVTGANSVTMRVSKPEAYLIQDTIRRLGAMGATRP